MGTEMIGLPMTGAASPQGAGRRWAATLAAALAVAVSLATPERAAACTLTTTGAATVDDGVLFTLTLGAVNTGDGLPTSWTISWGDGAIQTFTSRRNPAASVTHTYTAWATPSIFTYNILASAVCNGKTYFQNDLVVPSCSPLRQQGELVHPQRGHEHGRHPGAGAERAERNRSIRRRGDRRTGRKRLRQRLRFGKRPALQHRGDLPRRVRHRRHQGPAVWHSGATATSTSRTPP